MSIDINQIFSLIGVVVAGTGGTWMATEATKHLLAFKAYILNDKKRKMVTLGVAGLFSLIGTSLIGIVSDPIGVENTREIFIALLVIVANFFGAKGIHEVKK